MAIAKMTYFIYIQSCILIYLVVMVLKKYEGHGFSISNCVQQGSYLKVTEEASKSKKVVKFVNSEQYEVQMHI